MQDLEILIRYRCEKCGGDGALRDKATDKVVGNCSECGGQGKKHEWVDFKELVSNYYAKWSPF